MQVAAMCSNRPYISLTPQLLRQQGLGRWPNSVIYMLVGLRQIVAEGDARTGRRPSFTT
jgi:hypothetical protein